MSKITKKFFFTLLLCLFISFSSIYLGYEIITKYILNDVDPNILQNQISNTIPISPTQTVEVPQAKIPISLENTDNTKNTNEKIQTVLPSTQIVYEYYYKTSGVTKLIKQIAPTYLFGKTENEFMKIFSSWELKSFSEIEVHLKKVIEEVTINETLPNQYLLGIEGEFLAVYYYTGNLTAINENNKILKEITNIYISPLSSDEQEKLKNGIPVLGDDSLVKILEDYDS